MKDFSSRNRRFGQLLAAECRRLHITRDAIARTSHIGTHTESAVKHG